MTSPSKTLERILLARSDRNIRFDDLRKLLEALEFQCRIKGSHHIFHHDRIEEIVNLQPEGSGQAKAYQVRQVRRILTEHDFRLPE